MDVTCFLCPRECGIDRNKSRGFCQCEAVPRVAKVMLHRWEEPCICYGSGSGAVFFSGCQLQCVFCQNHTISCEICGDAVDASELADLFLRLEDDGACNINLVSPTPHLKHLIPALETAKAKGLSIPVVFNSGGYEKKETLRHLQGLVDIYLPDFKFASSSLSLNYANAEDYPAVAKEAIQEMWEQTGAPCWDGERLLRGVLVRHLILPGHTQDSFAVLATLAKTVPAEGIVLSLLRQYIPMHKAKSFSNLARRLTTLEYQRVTAQAQRLGFTFIYTQKKESASEAFVPDFSQKND